jgi:hypothetical protein
MTNRPEYIRCIAHTHADYLGQPWCGAASAGIAGHRAFFQSLDHAAYAIRAQSRLVPCPEYLEAARQQLTFSCDQPVERVEDWDEAGRSTSPYIFGFSLREVKRSPTANA